MGLHTLGLFPPGQEPVLEPGEPVTGAQVAVFVMDGHTKCRGSGFVRKAGKPTKVCTCAQRRFRKAHPEVLVDDAGNAWWPKKADAAPAPTTAEK